MKSSYGVGYMRTIPKQFKNVDYRPYYYNSFYERLIFNRPYQMPNKAVKLQMRRLFAKFNIKSSHLV